MHDMPNAPHIHIQQQAPHSLFGALIASIIKFPPEGDKSNAAYSELTCTIEDMACIYEIITTVAEHTKMSLFIKQNHLRQLEVQIIHVHPLKFLATIFKNPILRVCLKQIADDSYKWPEVIKPLSSSLTREADKGKLEKHLLDFSADIGVSSDHIRKYFQNRDWESLVRALMSSYD